MVHVIHNADLEVTERYCCPSDTSLSDCEWKGTPMDCADAKCDPGEVAIANDGQGDSFRGCACIPPLSLLINH